VSENKDTVIMTDEDTDGMCATRIVHNALTQTKPNSKHTIIWQDWDTFGVTDANVAAIKALKPETAYLLDLGSGLDMLSKAMSLMQSGINVVLWDNHPPDSEVETPEDYATYKALLSSYKTEPVGNTTFVYESTTENCTTGIVYKWAKRLEWPIANMEKWALLGLRGDVASDSQEGGPIYQDILSRHAGLKGLLATQANLGYDWGLIDFYAQLLHVQRRMVFNAAPPFCYEAMKELEQIPNWLELYTLITKGSLASPLFTDGKNPNTQMMAMNHIKYKPEFKKVSEDWKNNVKLEFPMVTGNYGVSVISHEWNIGSAMANKLGGQNKKPWFVINTIPKYGIHVSGRNGQADSPIHIGKVFRTANPTIMEGGGLREAGSAKAHINNPEAVLDELVRAVEESFA
jgi:single-stranded DNA-specific DHH superfamily exonuclease